MVFYFKSFCYCLDLYTGCVVIGLAGCIYSIVCGSMFYRHVKPYLDFSEIWVLVLIALFVVTKVVLLVGTCRDLGLLLICSFVDSIILIITSSGILIYWVVFFGATVWRGLLGIIFIAVEIYYALIVYSYWYSEFELDDDTVIHN